jgi:ubiquinone/menaquinone biosynthesis C-methylase UbiE
MKPDLSDNVERIRAEYQRRQREVPPDFYALYQPSNLYIHHGQVRALLWALRTANLLPLKDCRILEVGCGRGNWLSVFEDFEAQRGHLAGIDLDAARVACCLQRFAGADVRVGDASKLPWGDGQFDIVFQSTVFTSILDIGMKRAVAREMLRVLKPQGAILWYDFHVNNPRNPHVRGVGRREIQSLFPGCRMALRRVTLAPPLARRLVPISWTLSTLVEALRILNTHYFGVLRRIE